MNGKYVSQKNKCPMCGSHEFITLGFDQICCECDWDNSRMLVEKGQMNSPIHAYRQLFFKPIRIETKKQNGGKL